MKEREISEHGEASGETDAAVQRSLRDVPISDYLPLSEQEAYITEQLLKRVSERESKPQTKKEKDETSESDRKRKM